MHKKLFCFILLGTFIYQASQTQGSDAALQYLTSIGAPPSRDRDSCNEICDNITCASDLSNRTYRCFKECSQHSAPRIRKCSQDQFLSFIDGKINLLQQSNDLQSKQINELENQLEEQLNLKDEQISEFTEKCTTLECKNKEMLADQEKLQNKLGKKNEKISGLKEEKSQLEKTVLEAERKLEDQTAQLIKIGLEKSKLESDVEALQESHDKRQIQNEIDKKVIAQLEAEKLTLETVNNSLSGENQKAKEQLEQAIANKDIEIKNLQSRLINNNLIVQQNQQSEMAYEEKLNLMNAAYEAKNREAEKAAADLMRLQEAIRLERGQAEKDKVDSVKQEKDVTKLKSTLMLSILANAGALKEVEQLKEENRQLRLEKLKIEMSIFEELKQKYKNLAAKYQAYMGKKSHVFTLQEILTFIDKDAKERLFIGNMELNFKMKELKKRIDQLKKAYQEYKNKNEATSPESYREKRPNFPMKSREFSRNLPVKKDSGPAFGPSVNFEGSGQTVSPYSNFDNNTDYSHFDRPYSDESQDPYGRTNY